MRQTDRLIDRRKCKTGHNAAYWYSRTITTKALLTQRKTRSRGRSDLKSSSVDLIRTAFGYSFKESLVKQNQSPEVATRPTAKYV